MRTRGVIVALAALLVGGSVTLPAGEVRAGATGYTLETAVVYDVRPQEGEIGVTVDVTFTNTTPDPAGRFSVFDALELGVHDAATDVAARDADGELEVAVAPDDDGVNVATVELRDELRFEETAELTVSYVLPDSDDTRMRVRPSLIVFPAWGFGTSSEVNVTLPSGYDVFVDGDVLTQDGARLVSGPIEDPTLWLALVTATQAPEYTNFDATVPLTGGTANLRVRAFADDEAWGERILALLERALPMLEEEIGLPYPGVGQLVVTQSVPRDSSSFGEQPSAGTEILVAYDQPDFTVLHQVSHVWLSSALISTRWIREGMASEVAARVASRLEVEPPYDPALEAEERADAGFKLDSWSADAGPGGEPFGYAASWDLVAEIASVAGADAVREVLARVAASIGPYESRDIKLQPSADGTASPRTPLSTRSFLDHLETVSGAELAGLFAERVLTDGDAALLGPRSEARMALATLITAADGWGASDPIHGAMTAWSFDEALEQIESAGAWLGARDELLDAMEDAGLSAPDRLEQAYRTHGGGPDAVRELDAERAVVEAYAATADDVNAERSFIERVGLIGGPDPARELSLAAGTFADGDLRGSAEAITEAQRILAAAETGGLVRVVSAVLLALIVLGVALLLFRRRSAYTARP